MMPLGLTLVLLAWLCGCSTAAKISLIEGGQVEARIQRSDQDNLVVGTETGAEVPIPRSEISEIDHPGNVVAVIGGVLSAYGVTNIVGGISTCGEKKMPGAACLGVFWPATVGASMLTWGLMTWMRSTRAADRSLSQDSGTVPIPPSPSAFDFSRTPGGRPSADFPKH
jgi:hypothetical protein